MNIVSQFTDYAKWWLMAKIGNKRSLVNTTIIHYACNLRCKHCSVHSSGDVPDSSLDYDFIVEDMRSQYEDGSRILYFEGGETTLWKDGDKNLGDLIDAGRSIGYHNIGYTTNGTNRFFTNSDIISISLDGPKDVHDEIRGNGVYDKLMDNLSKLEFDGSVFANMTVQRDNLHLIQETAEIVRDNPNINGILFNFITPPPEDIMVTKEEKMQAVGLMLDLKNRGYPVLNSKKALKMLAEEDWSEKCPHYMTTFTIPGGHKFHGCPMAGTESCKRCGFGAPREYYLVDKGDPSTILDISSMFAMSK